MQDEQMAPAAAVVLLSLSMSYGARSHLTDYFFQLITDQVANF